MRHRGEPSSYAALLRQKPNGDPRAPAGKSQEAAPGDTRMIRDRSIRGQQVVICTMHGSHRVPTAIGEVIGPKGFGGKVGVVVKTDDGRELVAYWHELRVLA
jgi:hypothetical protein